MAQLEPSLPLQLKHLAGSGAVLPAEAVAALDHSLPIKRREAGLSTLVLWGRLLTRSGKDYLIAEGCNNTTAHGSAARCPAKYFFSQDGARWADLPTVDHDAAGRVARLRPQLLTGDPAHQYEVEEDEQQAAAAAAAAGGQGDDAGAPKLVSEVQRLRCIIDAINAATSVQPKGAVVANAHNQVVPNRLFGGLAHPDKLESYVHAGGALEGPKGLGLAADVRGGWSVQSDSFRGVTVLRSLLWPGYAFFFDAHTLAWGGLYVGDGQPNADLVFML